VNSVQNTFPELRRVDVLPTNKIRLYIGAAGFEDRSLGWCDQLAAQSEVIASAYVFKYINPKGRNRTLELRAKLRRLGASRVVPIKYDVLCPQQLEATLPSKLALDGYDEIVLDISAMTKLLELLVLFRLRSFRGTVRIAYSEAEEYCPSQSEYDPVKGEMARTARYPSRGAEQIVRLRCLNSIRMQGQPVTLVAFAAFNEKLVSHSVGFISPHRLILINGRPPRREYAWREQATFEIHKRFAKEYESDNPIDASGLLRRVASTLDYRETVERLEEIYQEHGRFERIICVATGSKMQTVGLFLAKVMHPDIQIEYPTPDSYLVKDITHGVRCVHEVVIPQFAEFIEELDGAKASGLAYDNAVAI